MLQCCSKERPPYALNAQCKWSMMERQAEGPSTTAFDTHGDKKYIDHIATPLKDREGNLIGAFVLIIDITKHKLTELELRNARDELEMRVEMRTGRIDSGDKGTANGDTST